MKNLFFLTITVFACLLYSWHADSLQNLVSAQEKQAPKADTDQAATKTNKKANQKKPVKSTLLTDARARLYNYNSVETELIERVNIGKRIFEMKGRYLQSTNLRLRLEYRLTTPNSDSKQSTGSLLQVCDGQVLYSEQKIGEKMQVTRCDVKEILETAEKLNTPMQRRMQIVSLGLGGLPAMLTSLDKNFVFEAADDTKFGNTTYRQVRGVWTNTQREKLLKTSGAENKTLPAYVPDEVRIYFDSEHLFPRRIAYLKKRPGKEVTYPMVTLDFVKVQLDPNIDPNLFEYVPPEGVIPTPITNFYIKQLKAAAELGPK